MESTDKLRNYVSAFISPGAEADLLGIADKIEREIAERYIELPVDADGVPIHPGNRVEMDGKGGEVWLVGTTDVMCNDGMSYRAVAVSHVKQRTIEDVLRDMLNAYDRHEDGDMPYSFIAEYADELRNMGVVE